MDNSELIWIGLALIVFGLLIVVLFIRKLVRFKRDGKEVRATIVEIYGEPQHRQANIEYTIDGQKYTEELSYFSNKMRVGEKITIYTNPKNPRDHVVAKKSPILIGFLFVIIGVVVVFLA